MVLRPGGVVIAQSLDLWFGHLNRGIGLGGLSPLSVSCGNRLDPGELFSWRDIALDFVVKVEPRQPVLSIGLRIDGRRRRLEPGDLEKLRTVDDVDEDPPVIVL